MIPSHGDGTSESTLSVATSNKVSSASTVSPTCFNQFNTVASEILSPIFGKVTSTNVMYYF